MPHTINGIGTSVCGGRGYVMRTMKKVGWFKKMFMGHDFDGFESVVVAFIPIIPYKPIHTYNWNGSQYNLIPIRFSAGLLLKTYLRAWLWLIVLAAFIISIVSVNNPAWMWIPAVVGIGGIALRLFLFKFLDKRDVQIRRILGFHQWGSSDPGTWTLKHLQGMKSAAELYNKATYASAVDGLLAGRKFSDAMWAARFATGLEDRAEGERLTSLILKDPQVKEALIRIEKEPEAWKQVMGVAG
jgi:hypothetical protein